MLVYFQTHVTSHSGEKRYACGTCGKQFSYKTSLIQHLKWHEGITTSLMMMMLLLLLLKVLHVCFYFLHIFKTTYRLCNLLIKLIKYIGWSIFKLVMDPQFDLHRPDRLVLA